MPTDSVQHPIPEGGGGETPAENRPNNESAPHQKQDVPSTNGNNGGHPKPWMRAVVIFAALQALGTIVDVISSDLTGYWRLCFHWIGLCCHVAGIFAVWHEGTPEIETQKKLRQVWMFCFGPACVVCALVASLVWWPNSPEQQPAYSLNVLGGLGNSDKKYIEPFWVVKPVAGTNMVAFPIDVGLFIQLTNMRDRATRINSYSIETDFGDGKWVKADPVEVRGCRLYWLSQSAGFRDALQMHTTNSFDVAVEPDIDSGKTIQGWIFLNTATGVGPIRIRFRLTDTTKEQQYCEASIPRNETPIVEPGVVHINNIRIGVVNNHVDISHIPKAE